MRIPCSPEQERQRFEAYRAETLASLARIETQADREARASQRLVRIFEFRWPWQRRAAAPAPERR